MVEIDSVELWQFSNQPQSLPDGLYEFGRIRIRVTNGKFSVYEDAVYVSEGVSPQFFPAHNLIKYDDVKGWTTE